MQSSQGLIMHIQTMTIIISISMIQALQAKAIIMAITFSASLAPLLVML